MTNLSFEDFLEAFVRAAGMKSLPTDKVRELLVAAAAAARGSSAAAAAARTPPPPHAARRARVAAAALAATPHGECPPPPCSSLPRRTSTTPSAPTRASICSGCSSSPKSTPSSCRRAATFSASPRPPSPSFSPALSPYAALLESFLRLQARAVDSLQPGARQPVHRCVDHLAALMIRTVEGGTSYKDDGKISRKEAAAFDQHGGS